MKFAILGAALILASASTARAEEGPPTSPAPRLHLVCRGDRIAEVEEHTSTSVSRDFDVTHDQTAASVTHKVLKFPGQVDVEIGEGTGRIHIPSAMIPTGSKFTDVWFAIDKLAVDDDKITGRFAFSYANKPTLRIDRHTGEIDLRGGDAGFSGSCEKSTAPVEAKKF